MSSYSHHINTVLPFILVSFLPLSLCTYFSSLVHLTQNFPWNPCYRRLLGAARSSEMGMTKQANVSRQHVIVKTLLQLNISRPFVHILNTFLKKQKAFISVKYFYKGRIPFPCPGSVLSQHLGIPGAGCGGLCWVWCLLVCDI